MKNSGTAIARTSENVTSHAPVFVEADKMFEKMAAITRDVSTRAFDFFEKRNGGPGSKLDDWLHAESELLQPAPVEITETDELVKVRAAVPGFQLDEIEVSVTGADLFLAGEAHSETKEEDEKYFYSEWRSNRFCRQLRLPEDVESEGVDTNLRDGVLTLRLKKKSIGKSA